MKILVVGSTGWIGGKLVKLFQAGNHEVICSRNRLDDYGAWGKELDAVKPTHVLLAAGLTGRPNIDWCEDHKDETLRINVVGTSVLADECYRRDIHLAYLGTGCIYEYDETHPIGGASFTETDRPNFDKSYYSKTKIVIETILKEYNNVLILRIRMPLSDDLAPRNFITKIVNYEKVVNVPNSMTVLTDLLPLIPRMMVDRRVGVYNFCNPGVISHNQILDLYRETIDPEFKYTNFSLDEQSKILKAGRSNNELDISKLLALYPDIPPISESIRGLFDRMRHNIGLQELTTV